MKSPLIEALLAGEAFPHATSNITLKETHISWVILTGEYAYKIKKPVDFQFLNYTELSMRQHFCREELRLNQRLAADLYLEVVPIYGTEGNPQFQGPGDIIEYAVKMRQFDSDLQFDDALARDALSDQDIDEVAIAIAKFHKTAVPADKESDFGTPDQIYQPVKQNFDQMLPMIEDPLIANKLKAIADWSDAQHKQLTPTFKHRRQNEHKVRECHGDFHLANITRFNDKVTIFDCIEFNEPFRFTDTMADVGFLLMDLLEKHHPDFAYRFLSTYLEASEDFQGLLVLHYYTVYRAMVRAKINLFRMQQEEKGSPEYMACETNVENLIKLSLKLIQAPQQQIVMMHGFSGSGKTALSNELLHLGMIRIRSDVIRKQLAAKHPEAVKSTETGAGLYTEEMSDRTYHALAEKARVIIKSGFPVIIDATFLKHPHRECFRHLSEELGAPWLIVDCHANQHTMEGRISARQKQGSDASDATIDVLKFQEKHHDALTEQEKQHAIVYDQHNLDGVLNQLHNYMFMQATLIE